MAVAAAVADRDLAEAHQLDEIVEGQRVFEIGVAQQRRQPRQRGERGEQRAGAVDGAERFVIEPDDEDRKSTRLNSSHQIISYAVFCLKKKKKHAIQNIHYTTTDTRSYVI